MTHPTFKLNDAIESRLHNCLDISTELLVKANDNLQSVGIYPDEPAWGPALNAIMSTALVITQGSPENFTITDHGANEETADLYHLDTERNIRVEEEAH